MEKANVWRDWTNEELERALEFWRKAVEDGCSCSDNRIDLLVEEIEGELARRAA